MILLHFELLLGVLRLILLFLDLVLGVILILLELVLEVLELSLGLVLLIFSSNFFWVQQLVILLISCQFAQFFF